MNRLAEEILSELGLGEEREQTNGHAHSRTKVRVKFAEQSDNRDGLVAVKEGKLEFVLPRGNGKYPTIAPGSNVTVIVNGQELKGIHVLSAGDSVEILPHYQEAESRYCVEVDDELMNAYLTVSNQPGRYYGVLDCGFSKDLVINAGLERETAPPPLAYEDLMRELTGKNVIYGVDELKIKRLLSSGENVKRELIAQGLMPTLPQDESIDYPYRSQQQQNGGRPLNEVISVKPGQVLAVKRRAVLGSPGMDLTGAVKDAPEPQRVEIRIQQGAQLVEDGTKAVAVIEGRPDVTNGYISVLPIYDHLGNVTPETGDIEFRGDVVIDGNVEDFMVVRASGNITVRGYVANAALYAGGNIKAQGSVIGSTLLAGGLSTLCREVSRFLREVDGQLRILVKSINQLQNQFGSGKLPVGNAVRLIVEKKLPGLPGKCREFSHRLAGWEEKGMLDSSVLKLVEELASSFYGYGPVRQLTSMEALLNMQQKVTEGLYFLESVANRSSSITGSYVQASTLTASSDICISGEGCFQSSLRAGGKVVVSGQKGWVRGGEITAGGNVEIKQAGNEAGVTTRINTTTGGTVRIKLVWPGVEIKAGEQKRVFYLKEHNVVALGTSKD